MESRTRTRRGRNSRVADDQLEEQVIEINHPKDGPMIYRPSTSLLPARPLGAPLDDKCFVPIIKKEVEEKNNNLLDDTEMDTNHRSASNDQPSAQHEHTSSAMSDVVSQPTVAAKKDSQPTVAAKQDSQPTVTAKQDSQPTVPSMLTIPINQPNTSKPKKEFGLIFFPRKSKTINNQIPKITESNFLPQEKIQSNTIDNQIPKTNERNLLSQEKIQSSYHQTSGINKISSKHSTSSKDSKKPLRRNLLKSLKPNSMLNKTDLDFCIKYLDYKFPDEKSAKIERFNYFVNDSLNTPSCNAVLESTHSTFVDLSTPTSKEISSEDLKKIIEISSAFVSNLSVSQSLNEVHNQDNSNTSCQLVNPNISIKTEPLDDNEMITNSSSLPRAQIKLKRSADEAIEISKKVCKTEPSDVCERSPLKQSPLENINPKRRLSEGEFLYKESVPSSSYNATTSVDSNLAVSLKTSYLDLLPRNIADNADMMSNPLNETHVNNTSCAISSLTSKPVYSAKDSVSNKISLQCNEKQLARETELFTKHDPIRSDSTSSNVLSTTNLEKARKKKLSTEEYLRRKKMRFSSEENFTFVQNPSVLKHNELNTPSQPLSFSASTVNNQTHNVSVALHPRDPRKYSSKLPITNVASEQQLQKNVTGVDINKTRDYLQTPSSNKLQPSLKHPKQSSSSSESHSKSFTNAPRNNSHSQNFDFSRGDASLSTVERDKIGKTYIETHDLQRFILEWNIDWLSAQKQHHVCPPICDSYQIVKGPYDSILKYYNVYFPLHLLSIWCNIFESWQKNKVYLESICKDIERKKNDMNVITCSLILNEENKFNWPKREDLFICDADGYANKCFGRVIRVSEENTNPYKSWGMSKKLTIDILCAESFRVTRNKTVKLLKLVNIRIALNQNNALKDINENILSIVLDPKKTEHAHFIRFVNLVEPFEGANQNKRNVDMIFSYNVTDWKVTIVNTLNDYESFKAILNVVPFLMRYDRSGKMLLICIKDEEKFIDLALRWIKFEVILAIKEEDIPFLPESCRNHTVSKVDSQRIANAFVILTFIPAMFFGQLENRLLGTGDFRNPVNVTCLIHEAQTFTETETALPLTYRVEKLILLGRRDGMPKDLAAILRRHYFNISLFHRFF